MVTPVHPPLPFRLPTTCVTLKFSQIPPIIFQPQPPCTSSRHFYLPPPHASNTTEDLHIRNDMAESSDSGWNKGKGNPPQVLAELPDEPQSDTVRPSAATDARLEASTELARLRLNYSRASSHPSRVLGSGPTAKKPSSLLEQCIYAVKRAWGHQVSIIVDHDTCRDHLGM